MTKLKSPKISAENSENFSEKSFTNSFLQMDCEHCDVVEDTKDHSFSHEPYCLTLTTTAANTEVAAYLGEHAAAVEEAKKLKIAELAAKILTVKHFRVIIKSTEPKLRKGVYDLIAPYILNFTPPTYRRLMGRSANRES